MANNTETTNKQLNKPTMTSTEQDSLLIFPINLDASAQWVSSAKALGYKVIGASSEATDPKLFGVDLLVHLPYVTDDTFADKLLQLLDQHKFTRVFTAHAGVWACLDRLFNRLEKQAKSPPQLCQPHPLVLENQQLSRHLLWAEAALSNPLSSHITDTINAVREPLSKHQYAGLHRAFTQTPGQCDDDKLLALCGLMQIAPEGDLIEIGSLYGRSATALASLAAFHKVGSTVCIDPWHFDNISDQGAAANVLTADTLSSQDNAQLFDGIFQGFLVNISQIQGVSYIRQPSTQALPHYQSAASRGKLSAPQLPDIPLSGKLSVLHIDGNHALEEVTQDVDTWLPQLMPDGWLLLDDYLWAFGDGPRKVGDALLADAQFDLAFVCADTLFLHKKAARQ